MLRVVGLVCLLPATVSAQELPAGTVLVVEAEAEPSAAAANAVGGARWRPARIDPRGAPREEPPADAVAELTRLWGEALAQRCLAQVSLEELDLDRLLALGHRDEAARVALYGALCLAPFDPTQAEARLRSGAIRELPLLEAAREANAEAVAQVDAVTRAVNDAALVTLDLRSDPAGARVIRDGGASSCVTPCTMRMRPGRHVLVATRLGRERTVTVRDVGAETGAINLALARPSTDDARAQLAAALEPGDPDWLRAAAHAYGATIVVLVTTWRDGERATARLYDRREDTVQDAVVERDVAQAVRSAVDEWWAEVRPEDPAPYVALGVIGGVLVVGAAVVVALAATGSLTSGSFAF